MNEILSRLPAGSRVLDLACAQGSFDASAFDLRVIRLDAAPLRVGGREAGVQADAAALPFRSASVDAVICNHGLEHFPNLDAALAEVGRVVKCGGAVYVSVPDCTTLTDKLYRWMGRGGGHVNGFRNPQDLIATVEAALGMKHVATRRLYTSLSFLNAANIRGRRQLKLALFLGGDETLLMLLSFALRLLDRWCGTQCAVYGWASYFGSAGDVPATEPWTNVCVRCGGGHPSPWLLERGSVRKVWRVWDAYLCPTCGARNLFTSDSC